MKGSCQCGKVNYSVYGQPLVTVFCYCTECQKLSAGIGSYSMLVMASDLEIEQGELTQYERTNFEGGRNQAHFCSTCGNRIYALNPESPGVVRIKAGTLDDAQSLVPDALVWTKSAPDWIDIPDNILSYETQPSVEQGLKDLAEWRNTKA